MQVLPPGSIRPLGWIAAQARANLDGFLGAMPRLCPEVGSHVFEAGRLGGGSAAENVAGVHWWNGESEGSWLWGWGAHVRMVGTAAEHAQADERFAAIARAGAADGYIGMFDAELRARGPIPGDAWTQSRVLGALREWACHTGSPMLQQAWSGAMAELTGRLGGQLEGIFAEPAQESLVRGHDLQIIDELAQLAAAGGAAGRSAAALADQTWREFDRASLTWTEDDCQSATLLSEADLHGHGPHVAENLRIPLLVAALTGDAERAGRLRAAFEAGWAKLARASGVTGALRSDEAVGEPGQPSRPIPEAGQEQCAITELTLTALHAAQVGQPGALDLAERLWLNAAQAARAADAGGVAYFTAENLSAATAAMGARWDISPTHDDAAVCCAPNAGRILPIVVDRSVLADDAGARVCLYGPLEARLRWRGSEVVVRLETDYPFSDTVRVHVSGAPAGFRLWLRRPGWLESLPVTAFTGAAAQVEADGVSVSGAWPQQAVIEVSLAAPVRAERAVDGRHALARGPLVYAVDIPAAWRRRREYEGTGLADRDAVPAEPEHALAPYLLPDSTAAARLEHTGAADQPGPQTPDPWAQPPLRLQVPAVAASPREESLGGGGRSELTLVPMGATTLRHTCLGSLER